MDDGEQVIAAEAFDHLGLVLADGRVIAIHHEQRLDGRIGARQRLSDLVDAYRPRRRSEQFGVMAKLLWTPDEVAVVVEEAAPRHAVLTGHGRQRQQRPHRLPAIRMTLNAGSSRQQSRLTGPVQHGEISDVTRPQAGDGSGPFGRIAGGQPAQVLEPNGPFLQEGTVVQPFLEQHVDHRERQRRVRTRIGRQVQVGVTDRLRLA